MALVLIDGSAASTRAIDVAIQPKLFIHHFESEQVILVHGWRYDPAAVNAKESFAGLQTILRSTTEQMEKSKFHQGQLNYKIELYKAPVGALKPSAPEGGHATVGTPTGGWSLAGYASERATHYTAEALILGVGNALNGKNLVVGSVAQEVMHKHSGIRDLWFIKASGATIRPTAVPRMLVIVDAIFAAAQGTHRALEHVARLTQPERRGKVSVIVIANKGGVVAPPMVMEALVKEAALMVAEDTPPVAVAEAGSPPSADGSLAAAAAAAAAAPPTEQPLVSTFMLEGTNQIPNPTVNDAVPQLTKYLGGFKTDFLVLTPPTHCTFTEATVMYLLSNPKYHIVVPRSLAPSK